MRSVITLATASVITATGATANTGLSSDIKQATAFISVSAVSGTAPSATFTLQLSTNGVDWADAASGAAMIAAGTQRIAVASNVGDFARVSYVVTGTTPSFTATITLDARGA